MTSSSQELHRIVRINEQIKSVVRPAFRISVMALNAIMLARRAGDAARGFGVLSDELRRFAGELSQQMNGLRGLTASSVATVTALVKEARYLAISERITVVPPAVQEKLDEVRTRQRVAVHQRILTLRQTQASVRRLLTDEILPLMQLGTVLARSAHIEAAYGGRFAAELGQVSAEFSRTIDEIETALTALHKATGDEHR
ncbi:chemotaxis protein [Fontimonas sp. SYSU GA230001]|uniref:chemotaxis protein n=1 Tax=Fontimonas sp. SYSU GA230001 TaxID=3142450 RepID=UPI0032B32511